MESELPKKGKSPLKNREENENMWTRARLKESAKDAFYRNYWKSVLVGLLMLLFGGGVYLNIGRGIDWDEINLFGYNFAAATILYMLLHVLLIGSLISLAYTAFLRYPLTVGFSRFFFRNSEQPASFGEIGYSFDGGRYMKTVGAMMLRALFVWLFSLLFVIPGIIKMYDYYLVGYILADDPTMSPMDALRKSKEMMRGYRWDTFVLNLSFLPWYLLGGLTCGVLNVFYITPYVAQTNAELYRALKGRRYTCEML